MPTTNPKKLYVIGTQHLDVAWLWNRVPHGEELQRMVFELALDLSERHPDAGFIMSRSTAWGFHIVERKYPELFARVQEAVAAGRIELCGGQWVEPDNVIPSGESMIRQSLYGQTYFQTRFGKTARVAWNPDVFAHGNMLAQIFARTGLEGYYFHRLIPRDSAGREILQFVWEAPDGSEVLCFAGNWKGRPDREAVAGALESAAEADHAVAAVVVGANSDRRMTIRDDWMDLPEVLARELPLEECRWAGADDVLAAMREYKDALPRLRGDLGGYKFTGTYTSDQITKRFNRRLENDLATAELINVWNLAEGGSYYRGPLTEAWRAVCLNQFHDIICGTSYLSAQEEAHALYRQADDLARSALHYAAGELSELVKTDEQTGVPHIVFNAGPTRRTDTVFIDAPDAGPAAVVAASGDEIPSQLVECDGAPKLAFVARDVPSCGADVYYVQPASEAVGRRDDELVLENEYVRVEFDRSYGSIISFFDKRQDYEYVKQGTRSNRIITYVDRTDAPPSPNLQWDPWYLGLTGGRIDPHGAYRVFVKDSGPVRKTIRVERIMHISSERGETSIVQDISLYQGHPTLHIHMHGNWQGDQACVKAEFDFPYEAETVACDMPYGVIERPADYGAGARPAGVGSAGAGRAEAEPAGEEPDRPMQMWLDFSDGRRGMAFLNNGKYGYSSTRNGVALTLMRAPRIRPGEIAGLGPFEFSYALVPHQGTWRDADVPAAAYRFNRQIVTFRTRRHGGRIPAGTALFETDDDAVFITAVKRAELGSAIILRLYESTGTDRSVTVNSSAEIAGVREVNAAEMEMESDRVALTGDRSFRLRIGGFACVTVAMDARRW